MSGTYGNSVEAIHDVINSYPISEITANLSRLTNGVEYSFVEVICDDGIQYGLQAYGKEALELYRVAFQELLKISLKNKK